MVALLGAVPATATALVGTVPRYPQLLAAVRSGQMCGCMSHDGQLCWLIASIVLQLLEWVYAWTRRVVATPWCSKQLRVRGLPYLECSTEDMRNRLAGVVHAGLLLYLPACLPACLPSCMPLWPRCGPTAQSCVLGRVLVGLCSCRPWRQVPLQA